MWDWGTYFLFVIIVLLSIPFLRLYDTTIKKNKICLLLGLLPTYLILVMRANTVGIDLEAYNEHILDVPYISYSEMPILFSEPISELVYWLSFKLGGLRAFIFFTSTLEYYFVFYALKELHQRKIDVSVFFLFFFAFVIIRSFNIVLNCLAITCSLCAYIYLMNADNKSKIKYWFFTIIAIGIHNTAIINIPIYFLCKPILKNFKTIVFMRFSLMMIVTSLAFVVLTRYIDDVMVLSNGQYGKYESSGKVGIGLLISGLPFIALIMIYRKHMKLNVTSRYMPYLFLLFFDLIFAQLRYLYPSLERITMYTNLGSFFLLNLLFTTMARRIGSYVFFPFLLWGICSITYWLYIYNVLGGDGRGVGIMPYHTWLYP